MNAPAAATAKLSFRVRPAVVDDVAFIASTWKQSYWRESAWGSRIRWAIFNPNHARIVAQLLERSRVVVACDTEREGEIFGYLVCEPDALHFAYTKAAFRRLGVFRSLLGYSGLPANLAGVAITHATRAWLAKPAVVDEMTGAVIRAARRGLEDFYPLAVNNPYRALLPQLERQAG